MFLRDEEVVKIIRAPIRILYALIVEITLKQLGFRHLLVVHNQDKHGPQISHTILDSFPIRQTNSQLPHGNSGIVNSPNCSFSKALQKEE